MIYQLNRHGGLPVHVITNPNTAEDLQREALIRGIRENRPVSIKRLV